MGNLGIEKSELVFIDRLGQWTERERAADPEELLRKYIAAALRRDDWSMMRRDVVIDHARRRLRKQTTR